MKKLFILLILISFKSFSYGQFKTITPRTGLTLSNCKDFEDTKYKPGYVLGASALYGLSSKFAIKPELLIEQKGFMSKIVFTDLNGRPTGTATSAVTWNYLALPVQFRYSFFKNNFVFISAGSYAGYMLWAADRFINDGSLDSNREKLDIHQFHRFEMGINAGGGIDIPLHGENKLEVEFRYDRSFRDQKNRFPTGTTTFSLSAGYAINLRK